ncbi:GNAT family N-acetyltransferase [Deinococcus aetherius]|uniref:GNAT family N-acetyltransferase n=1 Tax=Deinococcus aetherius TaxID=200252 RepID=A0ABN6R9K5_9DEIO|nr:GNAT family N-acetyltransferase [Deinococcus aetherius]BDP40060.1 GNAT family N-acetyltransferase [Deinococcus aetherius]
MNLAASTPTETPLTVRPFQNADAHAVARLVTDGVQGHWTYTPEQFRESDDPRHLRLVAERGGEVVATLRLSPFGPAAPNALRLDLAGDGPAFTALYLAALADLPGGFTRLLGVTREDWPETMGFFHAAGFRNAWQSWGAHLNLGDFDPGRFRPLEERLYLQGYEVGRLGPETREEDWDRLHALHETGVRDAPRHPTTTPASLTRAALRDTVLREEVTFVVHLRDEIVASTRLSPRGREVESEQTVTHPGHRSRGLATLAKAAALAWAREEGFTRASTGGAVLNVPMLRVNARLGYVTEAMWVTWERELGYPG